MKDCTRITPSVPRMPFPLVRFVATVFLFHLPKDRSHHAVMTGWGREFRLGDALHELRWRWGCGARIEIDLGVLDPLAATDPPPIAVVSAAWRTLANLFRDVCDMVILIWI